MQHIPCIRYTSITTPTLTHRHVQQLGQLGRTKGSQLSLLEGRVCVGTDISRTSMAVTILSALAVPPAARGCLCACGVCMIRFGNYTLDLWCVTHVYLHHPYENHDTIEHVDNFSTHQHAPTATGSSQDSQSRPESYNYCRGESVLTQTVSSASVKVVLWLALAVWPVAHGCLCVCVGCA